MGTAQATALAQSSSGLSAQWQLLTNSLTVVVFLTCDGADSFDWLHINNCEFSEASIFSLVSNSKQNAWLSATEKMLKDV